MTDYYGYPYEYPLKMRYLLEILLHLQKDTSPKNKEANSNIPQRQKESQ